MLSQIVQLVAEAQRSRAPIQRLADQVSGYFVPAVIAVALLAFAAWSIWGPEPRFSYGLVAAVAVLIIACPCALGLATPMSIMVGVGRGALAALLVSGSIIARKAVPWSTCAMAARSGWRSTARGSRRHYDNLGHRPSFH